MTNDARTSGGGDVAYFTICSINYFAYALTLAESLHASAEVPLTIFVVDESEALPDLPSYVNVVFVRDVDIPTLDDMTLRYNVMELNTAVKPYCFLHLFASGSGRVIYLDPDILVLRALHKVEDFLALGYDGVLTPHSLVPLDDGGDPDDVRLLRTGAYNLGFLGLSKSASSLSFLTWWAKLLETKCIVDLAEGYFVDQKFMDLAPSYLSSAMILKDPGYNVAYWNLHHRRVSKRGEDWVANNEPLVFFHFSGVDPADRRVLSKHQNRFTRANIGDAKYLLDRYLSLLAKHRHQEWKRHTYSYARFGNGIRITQEMRDIYRTRAADPATARRMLTGDDLSWMNELDGRFQQDVGCPITVLMGEVWLARADLRASFSPATADGRAAFVGWFVGGGADEHNLPASCVAWVKETFSKHRADKKITALHKPVRVSNSVPLLEAALRWGPVYRRLVPLPVRRRVSPMLKAAIFRKRAIFGRDEKAPLVVRKRISSDRKVGVDLFGYLGTESGVGEGARRAYEALKVAGVPTRAHRIGTNGVFQDQLETVGLMPSDDGPPYAVSLLHINADQTLVLGSLIDRNKLEGSYTVGYWAWELPTFPDSWLPALSSVDEIWVPSHFVRHALTQKTDKPVIVVPHPAPVFENREGSDKVEVRARFSIPPDTFAFLAIFDFNSYSARKNPMGAVEAFQRAFPDRRQDVCLVLKAHGSKAFQDDAAQLKQRIGDDPRIVLIDAVLDRDGITQLQRSCDAFVSLHRAEGFGLNIVECMSLAKPVIVTGFSGPKDFVSDDCGRPVTFTMVKVNADDYPHSQGQWWAEPNLDDAAQAMRQLASDPALCARLGAAAREVADSLRSERIGELMARRIDTILQQSGHSLQLEDA